MVKKGLSFFSGSSLGFGPRFCSSVVMVWTAWWMCWGVCWSLFDLGAFVFPLGVWVVCFVVFEHGFFGVF